jgi:hypothetical protein
MERQRPDATGQISETSLRLAVDVFRTTPDQMPARGVVGVKAFEYQI